jgi:peroxiredoxin Q/BCP
VRSLRGRPRRAGVPALSTPGIRPSVSICFVVCIVTALPRTFRVRLVEHDIKTKRLVSICQAGGPARRYATRVIDLGDLAPDFELPDQDGRAVKLSDFRGRPVVVYFYPKAATPGCTTQACGVRDHRADYEQANAVVLGISPDPVAKVKKFHDKEGLNFSLLADDDHAVAESYGVWVTKSMYGKRYWGVQRATFVVDADGQVAKVIPKVTPKTHDEEVLAALEQLAAA